MDKMKIRTIITQDAEVDDQNSLRHFLLYANEVELQGIVQSSSKFHWIGVPGASKDNVKRSEFEFEGEVTGPYDQPYRWPGPKWMWDEIDDYEKDYPNLAKHAEGYPTPDYLRSITKIGNIGYEGEMEAPTEGSELIREKILDDDPRTLYVQVWGGTNTLARALLDIQTEYEGSEGWAELHEKITKKVVITACGEQDPTYRSYIAAGYAVCEDPPDAKLRLPLVCHARRRIQGHAESGFHEARDPEREECACPGLLHLARREGLRRRRPCGTVRIESEDRGRMVRREDGTPQTDAL